MESKRVERCETCRFWDYEGKDLYESDSEGDIYFADCRRFPPIAGTAVDVDDVFTPGFPATRDGDWCGEWQPQKEDAHDER
jgi:hypothetical protein